MTAVEGAAPQSGTTTRGVPARADGIELLGESKGSGYRTPQALVRRADGQVLQLTPLLYLVLEALDGTRDEHAVAAEVSRRYGRTLDPDDALMLVRKKLQPLGLVTLADGSQPTVRKANPLLALRFRYVVSDPERTRRLTGPFAVLFAPWLVAAVTVAFAVVSYWVLFHKGLASAAHDAFASPGMVLAVFGITVISAGFHEFGHAAALRRGGGTPGAMGAGLYIIWPAFYTEVTDSYRLSRGGRLRTDLGGLYFNAIVALAMFGLWTAVGWDGLLLVIATQILQMIRQLPPLIRFDGYHILADLIGVPDLFQRIKPTLVGLWPTRWHQPESRALRPWARAAVTLWVLVVVPLMLLTVLVTLLTLPRIVATAGHSLLTQSHLLAGRWTAGDWLGVGVHALDVIAVGLPVFGVLYMLGRTVRQLAGSTWKRTAGRPGRRALAVVTAAALVAALTVLWWPRGNYRPIQRDEGGTIQQAVQQLAPSSATTAAPDLHSGQRLTASTVWGAQTRPPTRQHPGLAVVLTPRKKGAGPTWVFPFDRPAPPGVGDNQALAIARKDGSTVYDVAFALVWADSTTVLNRNEAYAFASCRNCTAFAVAFQVVLVVGSANVVAPQNISAAVSYDCLRCVTAALAVQLDLTLTRTPDAATMATLNALWAQIRRYGSHLSGQTFAQIQATIARFESQILNVVKADLPSTAPSTPPASGTAGVSPSGGSTPTATSPSGTAAGTPGSTTPPPSSASSSTPGSETASTSASPSAGTSSTPIPTASTGTP